VICLNRGLVPVLLSSLLLW